MTLHGVGPGFDLPHGKFNKHCLFSPIFHLTVLYSIAASYLDLAGHVGPSSDPVDVVSSGVARTVVRRQMGDSGAALLAQHVLEGAMERGSGRTGRMNQAPLQKNGATGRETARGARNGRHRQ